MRIYKTEDGKPRFDLYAFCATYIEFSKLLTEVTRQACTNLNFLFFREVDPMQQKLQHNKGSFSSVVLAKSLSNT